MRNLKRVLSLALAAMMLIGMMVVGASAVDNYEDFTDKDEIVNSEAVATMVALGVFNGKEDGSYFDPTGTVTRAEMAKIIAVTLNGGKDPVLGSGASVSQFSDVRDDYWATPYISYCTNLGIINGKGDGTFGPEEPVTGTAAAKMFLCALGYRTDIEGLTGDGWDLNTDSLANEVGLYDDMNIDPSAGLSRDNTALLSYNAVQAQEVEYRNLQGSYDGIVYPQDDGMMLTNRFNVLKVTGIAVANDKKTLDGYNTTKEGEGRIDVTEVSSYTTVPAALDNNPAFKVAMSDDMLGQEIVLYVKFLNNLSPNAANSTVLGNAIATQNNVVVETAARLKDTDAVKSLLRDSGIAMPTAGTAPAIQYTSGNVGNADSNGVQLTAGVSQRFIDNNGDGIVEWIIQETPALAKVTAVNTSGEKITFYGSIGAQDFDDVVGYEGLSKGDYVSVVKYDDDKYYVAKVEPVEAEVTAYTPGTVPSITADGTTYVLGAGANLTDNAKDVIPLSNDLIGNTYALYLDANGNILGGKLVESAVSNYAVVLGSSYTGNAQMGYSAKVKVLLADGTEVTYDVDLANTAVKLGEAEASDDTSDKEAAVMTKDYFKTDDGTGAKLVDHLFGYSVDEDGFITLSNPSEVNDNYDTADFNADQLLKKSVAEYDSSDGKVVADDNTIFFLLNEDGSYSVVTGLSNLPAAGLNTDDVNDGQVIYYVAPGTSTKAAKAVWVTIDSNYASSSSYAFISGGYTETTSGGTPIYTYPVVFEDGTAGTLSSKSSNGVKNSVMKYTLDAKGYATFETVAETLTSSRVEYVNGNSVSLKNKDTDAAYKSVVVNSETVVWNVTDTDNIYDSELSENDVVAIVMDTTDGTVKTAFVYDTMLGDMTDDVALTGTDVDSTTVTLAEPQDGQKVTVTFYDKSANKTETLKKDVTSADFGDDFDGDMTVTALAEGDILTVVISQDNKDTRTMTYEVTAE